MLLRTPITSVRVGGDLKPSTAVFLFLFW